MGDKEDYLTTYRIFFENFAATVNPEDQLPVHIAGYTITETELPGEVLYWTTQYLTEKQCPPTLMTPLRRIILDEVRTASKKQPNEFGYKSDESVYIALRLMQAVTARVIDVCLRYLDNSKLDSLPPPPPLLQRDMKTVSCATKNSRRAMEDRHVEIGNLEALFGIETTEPTSFYAVYDGHAGSAAATYCAAHLHQYLVESPHFKTDLQRAMRDAFLRTDTEFVQKSNQERACGGSTAVAVAIRARQLLAAWAGDSLALLAKRMRLMQLVRPHKPGRQDERDRIESSGGTVMYWGTWRVNGQLAVSRAIGDAQYKPYVTARPEIATVDLDGDEDFIVVACDGLWDFVSEDDVALAVYRQLALDPDDLKAVTKRLVVQAKRQGSADNITIIVVFLKDPRDIAADNRPPMELGLDNALANAPPPFVMETEACKSPLEAVGAGGDSGECADADNGLDNSDSDSEDLGPETAVDADDGDAEPRNPEPAAPTPPADTVEEGHVDGVLLDNVAESGEESEDEWNYFKGEGEREEHNPGEEPDEPPRSPTPCQDNSAWESSSVDMNSSPLNPDAPVFVPGSVAGADVLLAESPRKPMPMDDIELPDVAQFETEAVIRPAELLDLDNCDQLNGHHNVSVDEAGNEHLNGNDNKMDSLGFGFNVGVESEKITDTGLIKDFERIQKDTTDFCNIQVFQTHTETNPFASDNNDELFERLKNKERDPMSMSFYQEKDDDTCERLGKNNSHVDLNAVQPLPDSDDEDIQPNGLYDNLNELEKENISPERQADLLGLDRDISEPNNDILRFDCRADVIDNDVPENFGQGDNFIDYSVNNTNNMQTYNMEFESSNVPQTTVLQTDTPESHKLLFEQIPEIPDGKSSELGFTNEDIQDPSESEKDLRPFTPQEEISQDVDMESKFEDSPCEETQPGLLSECKEHIEAVDIEQQHLAASPVIAHGNDDKDIEIISETAICSESPINKSPIPPEDDKSCGTFSPEVPHKTQENIVVDVHHNNDSGLNDDDDHEKEVSDEVTEIPEIKLETEQSFMHLQTEEALAQDETPLPTESSLPSQSPLPTEPILQSHSPVPSESPIPPQSPLPVEPVQQSQSPLLSESPVPTQSSQEEPLASSQSPRPCESPVPLQSPLPTDSFQIETSLPDVKCPSPTLAAEPSAPVESPIPVATESPIPIATESPAPTSHEQLEYDLTSCTNSVFNLAPSAETAFPERQSAPSPLPADVPLPRESPLPRDSPLPAESPLPNESSLPIESSISREEAVSTLETAPTSASPAPELFLRPETASPVSSSPLPDHVTELQTDVSESRIQSEVTVDVRLQPEISTDVEQIPSQHEDVPTAEEISGTTPDIVPEERGEITRQSRAELVTDIDIGIPESRAQEICVPVTNEIHLDDAMQPGTATPPPTPAVEPPSASEPLHIPPLTETPIAADIVPAVVAATAVAAAAAAANAASASAAKPKAPTTKKPPTTPSTAIKTEVRTPKAAVKPAASPRTPASTTKKPSTTPSAARPSAPPKSATTPTSKSGTPATKPTTPATKTTTSATKTATSATKTTGTATRTSVTKSTTVAKPPTSARESSVAKSSAPARSTSAPKPAATARPAPARPTTNAAPAAKPASKPATSRPAPISRPAPRSALTAPRATAPAPPATKPKEVKPKPIEKKPLANGDVKEVKAPQRAASKPAASARPAPRVPPRAPAPPAPPAPTAAAKTAAPKPAPRATKPLDKQTKDLANKRITAKAAPPRTATTKAPVGIKGTATKTVPKKSIDSPKKEEIMQTNGMMNGAADTELSKPPPSPPAADNALLPDVIA